jgi:hypothetical protein
MKNLLSYQEYKSESSYSQINYEFFIAVSKLLYSSVGNGKASVATVGILQKNIQLVNKNLSCQPQELKLKLKSHLMNCMIITPAKAIKLKTIKQMIIDISLNITDICCFVNSIIEKN